MCRSVIAFVAILTAGLPFRLALAQDKPLSVFFQPCEDRQLNSAITAAMASQGFVQVGKPGPGVLSVTIPEIEVIKGRVSGTSWSYTVAFSRDGSSLGRAAESCNEKKINECTDQMMSDIRSAAGAP